MLESYVLRVSWPALLPSDCVQASGSPGMGHVWDSPCELEKKERRKEDPDRGLSRAELGVQKRLFRGDFDFVSVCFV